MSDLSFEQMLEESLKTIHTGEVVSGTVIYVKPDKIALNIGYKSDGIITREEYTNDSTLDLTAAVQVGDTIEAKVLKVNDGEGQVALSSKRILSDKINKQLEEACENKTVLTGKVVRVVDGGLTVDYEGAKVFVPASLVSDTFERDLKKYDGQEIDFVLTEYEPRRRRVIGDRKQLIVAKKAELAKELFSKINVGDIIEGTVKNLTDFGAFIDLGGADGLLHNTEIGWGKSQNPKKIFTVGQVVRAFIKTIDGEKIALSMKFPNEDPWIDAADKYKPGTVVTGRVARMTDFGAFVELNPGVDALLHVSQISHQHVDKPSDVLQKDQVIEAQIVDFNEEDRKISLSMKALEPAPEKAAKEEVKEEAPAEAAEAVEAATEE